MDPDTNDEDVLKRLQNCMRGKEESYTDCMKKIMEKLEKSKTDIRSTKKKKIILKLAKLPKQEKKTSNVVSRKGDTQNIQNKGNYVKNEMQNLRKYLIGYKANARSKILAKCLKY